MASITLEKCLPPVPSTERNFSTHLSYDKHTDSLAYATGKSALVRSLSEDTVVQFVGHGTATVKVVKFSPITGSQYLVSGDSSGKVIVWSWNKNDRGEIETSIKSEFQVLAGPISDISWDFEGKRLAVVGEGRDNFGAFISWDSGNSLGEVSGHSQRINAVHIKQSRPMRAFSVGDDGSVVFYQGPPFKFAGSDRTHHGNGKFVRDVRFSPGPGKYAITVGSDRKICCFDGRTGEFLKYIQDESEKIEGGLFAVDWLDEGDSTSKFVTVGADATARLWDVEENKHLKSWKLGDGLANQLVGVAFIKDDRIAALALDGSINVLFLDGKPNEVIEGHNKSITSMVAQPLVSGSYDGRIVTWSAEDHPSKHDNHENMIVAIDNADNEVSSISWDDTLKNFINGENSVEVKFKFKSQPTLAEFVQSTLAVITSENELLIVDNKSGLLSTSLKLDKHVVAMSLGSNHVSVGYNQSNTIEVFKLSDLSDSYILSTPLRGAPSCLSFSPSEKFLAAGDVSGKIILFDLETKSVKTSRWSFHTGKITSIQWRPASSEEDKEEDYVLTASLDTNIFVYSVKRPMKIIKKLNTHKDGVNKALWETPYTIVSSGNDAFIKRWSVEFP